MNWLGFDAPTLALIAVACLAAFVVRGLSGFGTFFVTLYLGLAGWPAGAVGAKAMPCWRI